MYAKIFKATTVISAVAVLAMGTLIKPWEGVRYTPYRDIGGILTVCYGHTGNDINPSKTYTYTECERLLFKDTLAHEREMDKYIRVPLPTETKAAFLSFTYNVGVSNFKNSTLLRKANSGDLTGACNELSRWVYVKRVRIKGLENRRISERSLCLRGLQGVI